MLRLTVRAASANAGRAINQKIQPSTHRAMRTANRRVEQSAVVVNMIADGKWTGGYNYPISMIDRFNKADDHDKWYKDETEHIHKVLTKIAACEIPLFISGTGLIVYGLTTDTSLYSLPLGLFGICVSVIARVHGETWSKNYMCLTAFYEEVVRQERQKQRKRQKQQGSGYNIDDIN